ncbi:MAG: sensor histidine kinase [Bifidobacteriaceae bacterium]|jgi:signal transduction histidine kinase|nr:sensor histidine kinase [Bifidobacteriaceae bacterium]
MKSASIAAKAGANSKTHAVVAFGLAVLSGVAFGLISIPFGTDEVSAVNGAADLRAVLAEGRIAQVVSGWESYPGELYTPADFAEGVARDLVKWENGYGVGDSFGTHRLVLLLPPGEAVALSFPSVDHATRVYIDGELAGEVGTVGATKETTTPRVAECYFIVTDEDGRAELVLQYANFQHRRGGDPPTLTIGSPQDLQKVARQAVVSQTLIAGLLLAAFFYHLAMFLFYASRRASLYFALLCLAFAIRAIVPSLITERWPNYDWPSLLRADYVLMFSGAALLMLFFRSFFPELLSRRVLWTVAAVLALYDLAVLVLDTAQSSYLLVFVQPLCVLAVGYIAIKLGLSLRTGGLEVRLAFAGIAFFLATALNDVLYLNKLPSLGMNLMPAGIAVLTLAYTVILTVDFARSRRQLTAARISEERMSMDKAALEAQSRLKTEFLQDISHEMKTPLAVVSTSVLNADDLLDFGGDRDEIRGSLRRAQAEVMRMAAMVDAAMAFSSANEAGQRMEALDLGGLLRAAADASRPLLERRGNKLALEIPARLPPLWADHEGLSQVLSNLLSNANRHTEGGRIEVTATCGEASVTVTVRDDGEGVDDAVLPRVFDRGASTGGTGLGLAISKAVIDAHGGRISLSNNPGRGACAEFQLPIPANGDEAQR